MAKIDLHERLISILEGECKNEDKKYAEGLIKKLTKKPLKIIKRLGWGGFGAAYLLSDGTVFKITTDPTEARASSALIGKKNKYLVDIYQVGKLNKIVSFASGRDSIWLIRRELIDRKFSSKKRKIINFLTTLVSLYRVSDEKELLKGEIGIKKMVKKWCPGLHQPKVVCESAIADLAAILTEMKASGISGYKDFSGDNLGIKNGNICVFDLGFETKAPKSSKIIKLVARVARIIAKLKTYENKDLVINFVNMK